MRNKIRALGAILTACVLYACAGAAVLPHTHPEEVRKEGISMPDCSTCHTDSWAGLNHQAPDFMAKHGFFAASYRQVCSSCHQESFCADCHTRKDEVKPSDKFADAPERSLPHRGDYLSQHRIDGRVNPVSCVKCHGRQNNERCASCHR